MSRHGSHIKHRSSIVAFVSVAAGMCLPSRCPETVAARTTENVLLLLRACMLRALTSNCRCLQSPLINGSICQDTNISVYVKIVTIRRVIMTIQCTVRALYELVAGSNNSTGKSTCQQVPLTSFAYKKLVESCILYIFNTGCYNLMWVCEAPKY
jgi:hypothetical protein